MTATSVQVEVKPKRIQRTRIKDSRLPEGTICCTRPGKRGNPFAVGMWFKNISGDWYVWTHGDSPHSLELFRSYATARAKRDPQWLEPLRKAKFLACWCRETATCHVDIIIELL